MQCCSLCRARQAVLFMHAPSCESKKATTTTTRQTTKVPNGIDTHHSTGYRLKKMIQKCQSVSSVKVPGVKVSLLSKYQVSKCLFCQSTKCQSVSSVKVPNAKASILLLSKYQVSTCLFCQSTKCQRVSSVKVLSVSVSLLSKHQVSTWLCCQSTKCQRGSSADYRFSFRDSNVLKHQLSTCLFSLGTSSGDSYNKAIMIQKCQSAKCQCVSFLWEPPWVIHTAKQS